MPMLRSLGAATFAWLVTACASDPDRTITSYESFRTKVIQSMPYDITTSPQSPAILSAGDVHAIEKLVAAHPEIRKPILRMHAGKSDYVQVVTGRDEHPGDVYNCFFVAKRDGKWMLDSPIVDERATEERAKILRQATSSI